MEKDQILNFLLFGVLPKPQQDSSSNQTLTSVSIPSTMEYLQRRRPDLRLELFHPQNQSEVSTELTLSCCNNNNSDQQRHKSYVVSNKRNNSCQNNHPTTPNKKMRGSGRDPEEMQWGYTTKLKLYDDPWKIKKCLTESDVGNLSRLFLATDLVQQLVLPVLSIDAQRDTVMLGEGIYVKIWDMDTESMHSLILKYWVSTRAYVILGSWKKDFVRRRNLKKDDVIGFHWDSYKNHFNFSVRKRVSF